MAGEVVLAGTMLETSRANTSQLAMAVAVRWRLVRIGRRSEGDEGRGSVVLRAITHSGQIASCSLTIAGAPGGSLTLRLLVQKLEDALGAEGKLHHGHADGVRDRIGDGGGRWD